MPNPIFCLILKYFEYGGTARRRPLIPAARVYVFSVLRGFRIEDEDDWRGVEVFNSWQVPNAVLSLESPWSSSSSNSSR